MKKAITNAAQGDKCHFLQEAWALSEPLPETQGLFENKDTLYSLYVSDQT